MSVFASDDRPFEATLMCNLLATWDQALGRDIPCLGKFQAPCWRPGALQRSSPMRACLGLFAHSVVAQFGTIHIDWVSEGALGDGRATPHVGGLSAGSEGEEPAAPSADTYEEAWWRDDFAHDPPSVWFGAATTQ